MDNGSNKKIIEEICTYSESIDAKDMLHEYMKRYKTKHDMRDLLQQHSNNDLTTSSYYTCAYFFFFLCITEL
jgi:hypothetical protein